MRATLISYTSKELSKTESSKLSKALIGYLDKSNNGKYSYKRKGLIEGIPHIKVANKTFILKKKDFPAIRKKLKKLGVKIKVWNIEIKKI